MLALQATAALYLRLAAVGLGCLVATACLAQRGLSDAKDDATPRAAAAPDARALPVALCGLAATYAVLLALEAAAGADATAALLAVAWLTRPDVSSGATQGCRTGETPSRGLIWRSLSSEALSRGWSSKSSEHIESLEVSTHSRGVLISPQGLF